MVVFLQFPDGERCVLEYGVGGGVSRGSDGLKGDRRHNGSCSCHQLLLRRLRDGDKTGQTAGDDGCRVSSNRRSCRSLVDVAVGQLWRGSGEREGAGWLKGGLAVGGCGNSAGRQLDHGGRLSRQRRGLWQAERAVDHGGVVNSCRHSREADSVLK